MTENEIVTIVLECAFRVHTELEPGLLETVYETALEWELQQAGLHVSRQPRVPFVYRGAVLEDGFRPDLVVQGLVVVELKSLEVVPTVAYKVLLTYLRAMNLRLGVLINFGEEHLKDGIKRVANKL